MPQIYNRLTIRTVKATHVEQLPRVPTYLYQLRAFVSAILDDAPVLTPPSDAIAYMRVVDAVYEQASLRRRGEE